MGKNQSVCFGERGDRNKAVIVKPAKDITCRQSAICKVYLVITTSCLTVKAKAYKARITTCLSSCSLSNVDRFKQLFVL